MTIHYYLFVLFYSFGWSFYFIESHQLVFFVMALFSILNLSTVLHPLLFHIGVLRPIQLSLASASTLCAFEGDATLFFLGLSLVATLVFLEKEDIEGMVVKTKFEENKVLLTGVRLVATGILPFAVVYLPMILRIEVEVLSSIVVLLYLGALYVISRWFDSILSFTVFMLIQMVLFVWVIELYLAWSSIYITSFFVTIFTFLLISYGRKGLLTYSKNE
jgi:hypothetical protein